MKAESEIRQEWIAAAEARRLAAEVRWQRETAFKVARKQRARARRAEEIAEQNYDSARQAYLDAPFRPVEVDF